MLGGEGGGREAARVNQLIWKVFTRKHGLTLQAEAVECLKRRLDCSLSEEELSSTFSLLVQAYKRQPGRSSSGRERGGHPTLTDQNVRRSWMRRPWPG